MQNNEFQFEIPSGSVKGTLLAIVEAWDEDVGTDDFIGLGKTDVTALLTQQVSNALVVCDLSSLDGSEACGSIHLRYSCISAYHREKIARAAAAEAAAAAAAAQAVIDGACVCPRTGACDNGNACDHGLALLCRPRTRTSTHANPTRKRSRQSLVIVFSP